MDLITQCGGTLACGVVVGRQFWGDVNYRCIRVQLERLRVLSEPISPDENCGIALAEILHVYCVQSVSPRVSSGFMVNDVGPYLLVRGFCARCGQFAGAQLGQFELEFVTYVG